MDMNSNNDDKFNQLSRRLDIVDNELRRLDENLTKTVKVEESSFFSTSTFLAISIFFLVFIYVIFFSFRSDCDFLMKQVFSRLNVLESTLNGIVKEVFCC